MPKIITLKVFLGDFLADFDSQYQHKRRVCYTDGAYATTKVFIATTAARMLHETFAQIKK